MYIAFINPNIASPLNRVRFSKHPHNSHKTCPAQHNARSPNFNLPNMSALSKPPIPIANMSRRAALQLLAIGISTAFLPVNLAYADAQFKTYKGPISLGFSFSYPSEWIVKKKPIKTHLSEVIVTSDKETSTSAGLVVDAVKIDAIDKFGTPDVVGNKVVDMELRKESVTNAILNDATSVTKDGLTYYVVDYSVNSTRGVKRYQAKATITGNQLYVFTAQAKTDNFEGTTEQIFSVMLDSFTVARQYL